jgi:hypothetical protein
MTDLTHDKTYRFLMLLFMAVIALSSVLVVLELHRARVVATFCGGRGQQIFLYSDGKVFDTLGNKAFRYCTR